MSALSDRPEGPIVGLPEPHESAVGHVTGSALYTDDIATGRKDALSAWPVQSTQAHARITALRTDPALAVPGVVQVLTADDVPGLNDAGIWGDEPLFPLRSNVLRTGDVLGAGGIRGGRAAGSSGS